QKFFIQLFCLAVNFLINGEQFFIRFHVGWNRLELAVLFQKLVCTVLQCCKPSTSKGCEHCGSHAWTLFAIESDDFCLEDIGLHLKPVFTACSAANRDDGVAFFAAAAENINRFI